MTIRNNYKKQQTSEASHRGLFSLTIQSIQVQQLKEKDK